MRDHKHRLPCGVKKSYRANHNVSYSSAAIRACLRLH